MEFLVQETYDISKERVLIIGLQTLHHFLSAAYAVCIRG